MHGLQVVHGNLKGVCPTYVTTRTGIPDSPLPQGEHLHQEFPCVYRRFRYFNHSQGGTMGRTKYELVRLPRIIHFGWKPSMDEPRTSRSREIRRFGPQTDEGIRPFRPGDGFLRGACVRLLRDIPLPTFLKVLRDDRCYADTYHMKGGTQRGSTMR